MSEQSVTCPYCGATIPDLHECDWNDKRNYWEQQEAVECPDCGTEVLVKREVSVEYSVLAIKHRKATQWNKAEVYTP